MRVRAQEQFIANDHRRGVNGIRQFVGGKNFDFLPRLQHERHAFAAREIDASARRHRRRINSPDAGQPFLLEMHSASLRIHSGQNPFVALAEVEQ